MSIRPSILLLGGGYCLQHLATILPAESFIITSRNENTVAEFQSRGFLSLSANLTEQQSLERIFQAYPGLHTLVDSIPPLGQSEEQLKQLYIPYLEFIKSRGIKRFIFLSSTGVYGQEDGSWVTEQSKTEPFSPSGKKRLWAESLYLNSGLQGSCFRLSGIYGPGRGMRRRLESGEFTVIEGWQSWSNRIHVTDIAAILKLALESTDRLPELINLSDDRPAPLLEVVDYYCKKYGIERSIAVRSVTREQAEAEGRLRLMGNKRVSNHLLHQTFDYALQFPDYTFGE